MYLNPLSLIRVKSGPLINYFVHGIRHTTTILSMPQRGNAILVTLHTKMLINEILQSDWFCDYSCSDTSAIDDCHQTLALRTRVWLCQTRTHSGH